MESYVYALCPFANATQLAPADVGFWRWQFGLPPAANSSAGNGAGEAVAPEAGISPGGEGPAAPAVAATTSSPVVKVAVEVTPGALADGGALETPPGLTAAETPAAAFVVDANSPGEEAAAPPQKKKRRKKKRAGAPPSPPPGKPPVLLGVWAAWEAPAPPPPADGAAADLAGAAAVYGSPEEAQAAAEAHEVCVPPDHHSPTGLHLSPFRPSSDLNLPALVRVDDLSGALFGRAG